MKSVASGHFPRVAAESNRFWLFNPILKKRYDNRPEERVRLRWVEYILHQTVLKKSRIGFESPVKIHQSKNTLRADLVLYSEKMKPDVLIECKSVKVSLNHTAAEQAARYNTEVNAPYLVLTNGIEDFWFEQIKGEVHPCENIFNEHTRFADLERDFEYWYQRGFCSSETGQPLKIWLTSALRLFWSDPLQQKNHYLDFKTSILPIPMNHYYRLFDIDSERRLAISFIGHSSSDNYIVGILNVKGVNKAVLTINLNQIINGEKKPVSVYTEDKQKTVSMQQSHHFQFDDFSGDQIKNLPDSVMKFFD